MELSNVQEAEN